MSKYFVYGTLKKDLSNHWLLKECKAEFISEVQTVFQYPMVQLKDPFPYLVNVQDYGRIIKGELYEIDSKYDDRLDQFEGVPTLYERGKIRVKEEGKEQQIVNCYFSAESFRGLDESKCLEEFTEDRILTGFNFEEYYKKFNI